MSRKRGDDEVIDLIASRSGVRGMYRSGVSLLWEIVKARTPRVKEKDSFGIKVLRRAEGKKKRDVHFLDLLYLKA